MAATHEHRDFVLFFNLGSLVFFGMTVSVAPKFEEKSTCELFLPNTKVFVLVTPEKNQVKSDGGSATRVVAVTLQAQCFQSL